MTKKIGDNPNMTVKERNLTKGALRRVFSRSEIRRAALSLTITKGYSDPNRKRVTKWSFCPECALMIPTYLMVVDHVLPIVPLSTPLESMTWEELIERLWCGTDNLRAICTICHKLKSKGEAKERAKFRKARKLKEKLK